jgi:hypothetical protein
MAAVPSASYAAKPGPGASTGVARVFLPNPVQSLGDQSLTDQKDSAGAVPDGGYYLVPLTNLDGSGFLVGDWANVRSETGDPAYSPTNTFVYDRDDDRFEQVMAYFWTTEAQKYLRSLGFTGAPRQLRASTRNHRTCGSTSGARTIPSPGTNTTTSSSARVASTTPRTAR